MAIDLGDIPSGTEPTTAEKLQIRSAIGVGTTDAPTFLALTAGTGLAKLEYTVANGLTLKRSSDGAQAITLNAESNMITAGSLVANNGIIRNGANNTIFELGTSGTVEQRNGDNAQSFRVYDSYNTAGANFCRANLSFNSNRFELSISSLGSGSSSRGFDIGTNGTGGITFFTGGSNRWQISGTTGHLLSMSDNAFDIGASGGNRPRFIYAYNLAPSGFLSFQNDSGMIYFGGGGDVIIQRDAAGILSQKNGTSAQAFRVYNQGDAAVGNPTNYDRGVFDFKTKTNTLRIGTENGGTYTLARPIEFVTGEVVRMSIAAGGAVTVAANLNVNDFVSTTDVSAGTYIMWGGGSRSRMTSPLNGIITLYNSGATDFGRLQLGGTTSAFPAIKRNGTAISIVLADDSGPASLNAGNKTLSSTGVYFGGTGSIQHPSDGVFRFTNAAETSFTRLELGTANLGISRGTGSPEGVVTALVGSLYIRTDGGASTTLYVKESSPTPSTGWVAK